MGGMFSHFAFSNSSLLAISFKIQNMLIAQTKKKTAFRGRFYSN
jgi:hypothetical protein